MDQRAGRAQNGIQISLGGLNGTNVNNKTATEQSDARTFMVRDVLWAQNKRTDTHIARLPRRTSNNGSSDRGL